jgi:hypothetical protein
MAEQPTTMFDPPAGDRPASQAYQPGTWLTEPDPGDQEADDAEPPPATASHRLLLHRLLDTERRLAGRRAG